MLELQSYGVAQHIRPVQYLARRAVVAVQALVELRWVDGGELAGSSEGVGVFDVRDGLAHGLKPEPDLQAACRAAGWAQGARLEGGTT